MALGPHQLCPQLVAWAVLFGTLLPFQVAARLLTQLSGVSLSAETVRRMTECVGAAAVARETAAVAALERDLPDPPPGPAIQQLSVDGALVPLVGGTWSEVKTLAIGTVQPAATPAGAVRTSALSYFSRLADAETFGRLATIETHRRGTTTAGVVVGVVDGAVWCQGFLDLQRHDAVRVLDFAHAVGYLARAAEARYPGDPLRAQTWLAEQRHTLLTGDPEQVLAALRQWQVRSPSEAISSALQYLEARRTQITYAHFRAQGYPIGSGTVESANKLIVEARLKGRGMHWRAAHVNPLVCLRCLEGNGRWSGEWPQVWAAYCQERRDATAARWQQRRLDTAVTPATPPPVPVSPPPPPPPPTSERPRLMVNGRPTKEHPWRKHQIGRPRSA